MSGEPCDETEQEPCDETEQEPCDETEPEPCDETEPEPCVICLDPIQDPATLPCKHAFCFVCVLTAAETFSLSSCAVCRTPFSSVRHRGVDEPIMIPSNSGAEAPRPRTVPSSRDRRRRRRGARRNIYLRRLFARPLVEECLDGMVRLKDTSPEFYKQNPAALHPLVPFMHRDLRLFLPSQLAKQLEKTLMQMFKQYEMLSVNVTEYLEPFLGRFAAHFQHEVRNFAQSICDLDKYDRLVQHRRRRFLIPPPPGPIPPDDVLESVEAVVPVQIQAGDGDIQSQ